ncbi:MAG: tetratricopeptide repeat protein [Gammaproteobacteria bacterium]|nr:tetratricopeptide repeat protein [Gammaproteobacteria bacterium]
MKLLKPCIYSVLLAAPLVAGGSLAGEVDEGGVVGPAVELPVEADAEMLLPGEAPADDGEALSGVAAEEPGDALPAEESLPTQAVIEARARLQEIEEREGPESPALSDALESLAITEIQAGDLDAAETSLKRSIEAVEFSSGVYSQRLARPLALLGELYIDRGKLDDALEAYRRAQHVLHRADGVYTLEQLDYLDKISSIFVEKRKYAEADRHKNFSFFVSEKNYGPESPDLVPAIMDLGGWLQRVGKTREARKLYERAAGILEQAYGADDPSLIQPLLALGTATRKRGQYRKQREGALKRVVNIVSDNEASDASDKAESWAKLGDFYILVDDSGRAAEAYANSWEAIQEDASLANETRGIQSEPRLLHFQRRIYLMQNTPRSSVEGYDRSLEEFPLDIEFEVSVGPNGQVLAVRALNLNATATTRRQLRRYVREARFRPAIIDGKPVRADNFRFKERVIIVRPEGG